MFLRPLALLLLVASNARAKLYEDLQADAIVVEADPVSSRDGRQLHLPTLLFPQIYQVTRQVPTSSHNHAHCILKPASNNSKTGEHTPETGICRGVNECYKYFKLPRLSYADTYVMGDYNTCSYVTPLGKQIFGVCCNLTETELTKSEEVVIDVDLRGISFHNQRFKDWTRWGAIKPAYPGTNLDTKIVNGEPAQPHEFPFMAALMNHNRQFCGGSLIDNLHILTAAHCVAHMSTTDVKNLRVRLGDHNIKTSSEATHVEMKVRRVVRHKGFSSKTLHNDVAILTLESPVTYSATIQPIQLAEGSDNFVGEKVTVAGWGTLREGGIQPGILMKVSVEVWTNRKCKNSYGNNAPGGITEHMICASSPSKDSCSGDSGGPLFLCPGGQQQQQHGCIQVGIVSWGIGCAQAKYPGVYSRVSELLPWIEKIRDEYF